MPIAGVRRVVTMDVGALAPLSNSWIAKPRNTDIAVHNTTATRL